MVSSPAALPVSIASIQAFLGGMGFESLPPLPIISKTFGFLKCVNLNSVGLGLNEIPFEFGWDLVMWKPILAQAEPKGALGPSELHIEVVNVVDDSSPSEEDSDSVMTETGSEPVSNQIEFGTRSEPVPEIGETRIEPPLVFEENVDDSFDRVPDFDKDEEAEILILAFQPTTLKVPQRGEGQKKKRIKTPAGRIDLPLVRQFKAM